MIIRKEDHSGPCSCGRDHALSTQLCVIESGSLLRIAEYLEACNISGNGVVVYDENTYRATEGRHPAAMHEIILSPEGLHADDHAVALVMPQIPEGCDYLIAIGGGSIHDVTRYCAYKKGVPFVACPTCASVDGFCSSVAAVTWEGFKKTLSAVSPTLVVADLDVIRFAPVHLAKAGFADLMGKYIALTDWKIGNILTGEYFCPTIFEMTQVAAQKVLECAHLITERDEAAYEKLMYGLILSGLAMQLLGNSRCASGAEHHVSHLIEMEPEGLGAHSDALHGEKVGVATLLYCQEYHRLKNAPEVFAHDYVPATEEEVENFFGKRLCQSVMEENAKDCAEGITAEQFQKAFPQIAAVLDEIPTAEHLQKIYDELGVMSTLSDLGVDDSKKDIIFHYSPIVRNRLTLMRLQRGMKA